MKRRQIVTLLFDYSKSFALAIGLALVIRSSVVEAYRIPSGSMQNTLLVGDRLFANKFIYGAPIPLTHIKLPPLRQPRVGDIIIFQYPEDPQTDFVKRVVALSGQVVEVRAKQVYVDGRHTDDGPTVVHEDPLLRPPLRDTRDFFGPVRVPKGCVFVMGDNRDNSYDSRYWGFLDTRLVLGRAEVVFWSWDEDPRTPLLHRVRWGRIGHVLG